jgi:hypothetical protein
MKLSAKGYKPVHSMSRYIVNLTASHDLAANICHAFGTVAV